VSSSFSMPARCVPSGTSTFQDGRQPAELKLAQQLIEQQSSEKFDPAAYKDEVRERIETAVQKKVEGQEITLAEEPAGGPR